MSDYREKKNNYRSNKNAFYKRKDAYYRKKIGFNKSAAIITGLIFLVGIMVGLVSNGNVEKLNIANIFNKNKETLDLSNKDSQKSDINLNEGETKDEVLEEVPDLDVSVLTEAEIAEAKKIINSDTSGLFKLVNKENTLDENYNPNNLITPNIDLVTPRGNERNLVRQDMVSDLEQMFHDAESAGVNLFLSNGFRDYNSQEYLHTEETGANGSQDSVYVASPGSSEHQLGLAIDITSATMEYELEQSFENTKEGAWALENAYKYGFILRYINNKEQITGYKYEPWHYRYIGNKNISKLCHDKNLTLEELMKYISGE